MMEKSLSSQNIKYTQETQAIAYARKYVDICMDLIIFFVHVVVKVFVIVWFSIALVTKSFLYSTIAKIELSLQ